MNIFGNKALSEERTAKDCIQLIEAFLRSVGLNPKEQRLTNPNTLGWLIIRGSAKVFILIGHDNDEITLEIVCPILHIPSQNILPFYRKCLEINRYLTGCALCVNEDQVLLVSGRNVQGLDYKEVETMIHYAATAADGLDNKLAEEFGAKLWVGT